MENPPKTLVLSRDQTNTVLRTTLNILAKWGAATDQSCKILRMSSCTIDRATQGQDVELDVEQLLRASIILNCHAALRLLFDRPVSVYGFPSMKNYNDFFNGRTPLEIMAQGDLMSLIETHRRIDELQVAGEPLIGVTRCSDP